MQSLTTGLRPLRSQLREQKRYPVADDLIELAETNRQVNLFVANTPSLTARCTRDSSTPGMCLSARRVDGADLTFRFPRSWLGQWRDVANAMDRLTVQLHGPGSNG